MRKMIEVTETNAAGQTVTHSVNKLIELDIGIILGAVFSFLLTAAVVFFVIIKPMNKLVGLGQRHQPPAAPPEDPADIRLLREIRDLLKQKSAS